MTPEIKSVIAAIRAIPDRPHHTDPDYERWFAEQVWKKAQDHYASVSGPECSAKIMSAAGVVCCDYEQGGPGWIGVI